VGASQISWWNRAAGLPTPSGAGLLTLGGAAFGGGLRLQGVVARRSKRTLKEDLEAVTFNVSSQNGSHFLEDFVPPGGPSLALGQGVDLDSPQRSPSRGCEKPWSRNY
jgi:hypothetical protein